MGCCERADLIKCCSRMNSQSAVNWVRGDLPVEMVDAFTGAPRIAWDVETTGLDWRRDRVATCQIFAEARRSGHQHH